MDGWMDMDVSKISDLQVPIHLKFNLECRKIQSVQKAMNEGRGGGPSGPYSR
jgi:hypothetical protein